MSEIALEAWGEHEALLLKPPRSPLSIPPPQPRPAVPFPRRGGVYTEPGGDLDRALARGDPTPRGAPPL